MRKFRFITVGLGPVGRALAAALKEVGYYPISLVGRGRQVEKNLARKIGTKLTIELSKDIDNVDFILIALPSSKLSGYAQELAKRSLPWTKLTFLHASGSLGIAPFAPLAKRGAGVAAMHPYQTFPKRQATVNLQGITYGITGNRKGTALARRIARDIGGHPIVLREEDRMLYHLSAIVACTFVAADIDSAVKVLKSLGISERQALQTVLPIAEETIRNLKELGIRAAMTGPQTRGDRTLIRRHLKELHERFPELKNMYRSVSELMMEPIGLDMKKKSSLG